MAHEREQAGLPPRPEPERPVLARDPAALPDALPRGADVPDDLDPFAEGILMRHQVEWLADKSDLKLAEKGRRTGITFAEALDATLTAAAARSAGGQNVFYIGDTREKGREFVGYVAHFARVVAKELGRIEEFLFEDQAEDGSSRYITAYRVRFASGFRVEALSSRPENIRGLQGVVVIDEAAFHRDVRSVLDAVNALLIWGGKVRVISTHNGVLNPFNELVREVKAGKLPFSHHFIPFSRAVRNGLYRRVCAIRGIPYSREGEIEWERRIRAAYGSRVAAMRQELDCVPADAEGAALTRVEIERRMVDCPVVRKAFPQDFRTLDETQMAAAVAQFCARRLAPVLSQLKGDRPHVFGLDFARSGDVTALTVFEIGLDLVRRAVLHVELMNAPFDAQREILFFIGDRLPRLAGAALDARGNGQYLAEKARQRWGDVVREVMFSQAWYAAEMPPYIEAFRDGTVMIPRDADVLRDHQALQLVSGIYRVPEGWRYKGADGHMRHGDAAISCALAFFASRQEELGGDYHLIPHPNRIAAEDDWPGADSARIGGWRGAVA